jgi:hypothetical protein
MVRIVKEKSEDDEGPAHISMSEGLSFVWELTEEVFSLSGRYDVKSRLQRHIVTITRK